jgi:hypothetical protein
MTYLELMNAVLVRLREDTVDANTFNSDPYFRFIGSAVNDAKDRVEDAWQWTALRGTENTTVENTGSPDDDLVTLTGSGDNNYVVKGVYNRTTGRQLKVVGYPRMRQNFIGTGDVPFDPQIIDGFRGEPLEIGQPQIDPATGDLVMFLFPIPDKTYQLAIDYAKHQSQLVGATDRLLVPSLPVYTLATALASRERGEVGGTPVSELFAIADRHLSDAIAMDSTFQPAEMDWSSNTLWNRTNFRTS